MAPEVDLLSWPEYAAARHAARVAAERLAAARRRARLAPHGQVANRAHEVRRAMAEALEADLRLSQVAPEPAR